MPTQIRGILLLCVPFCNVAVYAQVEPASSASDYPYHCQIGGHEIGVDYLARQLPTPIGLFPLADVLVLEVGVFPAEEKTLQVGSSNLELVVNKASFGTPPTDGSFVAAMLRHPEWAIESKPRLTGSVGTGSGAVIFGPQHRGGRFPGDPRAEGDYPRPAPNPPRPSDAEASVDDLAHIAIAHELPRHVIDRPTAGYAYFHEHMLLKKIKELEVRVHLDDGDCSLAIDPQRIAEPVKHGRRPEPEAAGRHKDSSQSPDRPRDPRYVSRVSDNL